MYYVFTYVCEHVFTLLLLFPYIGICFISMQSGRRQKSILNIFLFLLKVLQRYFLWETFYFIKESLRRFLKRKRMKKEYWVTLNKYIKPSKNLILLYIMLEWKIQLNSKEALQITQKIVCLGMMDCHFLCVICHRKWIPFHSSIIIHFYNYPLSLPLPSSLSINFWKL